MHRPIALLSFLPRIPNVGPPMPLPLPMPLGGAPAAARARRGDLAVLPDQAFAASAPGAPCLGVLSLVRDTLELNYCTKLFHQTVHARSCKTRCYTNVVCCSAMRVICIIAVIVWAPSHVGMNWWPMRSSPLTKLLMILLRHPPLCAWIVETRQMNVLRCRSGSAMFKGKRDVCTSVVPKGYLSSGSVLGGVSKPAPYG